MHEVYYSHEFDKDFLKLKKRAEKGESEAKQLLLLIEDATRTLEIDRDAGVKVPRKLWPKEYVQKYGITNLWKYNLDAYWRLTYTITGDSVKMYLIYLEYLPHPEYERRFGYRKN